VVYAIKAEISDPRLKTSALSAQKTMYGGKQIAAGAIVYVFASENEGGQGLVARGIDRMHTPLCCLSHKCFGRPTSTATESNFADSPDARVAVSISQPGRGPKSRRKAA
jgi:hypothetical protein